MQPAAKLIARSPGLPAGVLHLCRHRSCSRLIGREAGQIGFEIGKRDQCSPPRLASGDLVLLEQFIKPRARHARELLSFGQSAVCFHGEVSRKVRAGLPERCGKGWTADSFRLTGGVIRKFSGAG